MKPLPSLLRIALADLEMAYAIEGVSHVPSLDLWANLLRVLDEAGVDSAALPAMLRLSKRAVRRGWVEERKADQGGRRFI